MARKCLFLFGFILGIWFFAHYIFFYIAPFIFGFLLALFCSPLFNLLKKLKFNDFFAALICVAALVIILFFAGFGLVHKVFIEARDFFDKFPTFIESLSVIINKQFNQIISILPFNNSAIISGINDLLSSLLGVGLQKSLQIIPYSFINFIICLVSCFFFLKDRNTIYTAFVNFLPQKAIHWLQNFKVQFVSIVAAYLRTQLIIMCFVALICFIGLLILQQPYSLFLCLLIAVIDSLPLFGSGLILLPWALFSFFSSNHYLALGLFVIYLVIFITRQLIEPKLFSMQIGIHPLLMLAGVYIGVKLIGFFGIFVAPVALIILKTGMSSKKDEKNSIAYFS